MILNQISRHSSFINDGVSIISNRYITTCILLKLQVSIPSKDRSTSDCQLGLISTERGSPWSGLRGYQVQKATSQGQSDHFQRGNGSLALDWVVDYL
jgi:hypothetical protein